MQDFSEFVCSLSALHQLKRFCNSRLHCNSRFNGNELLITKQGIVCKESRFSVSCVEKVIDINEKK